jgi:RNA-splicing ligase RtcB
MINKSLRVWGEGFDANTIEQAKRTARLPILAGHLALMPDAHLGYGGTVGSVIPTDGAVIPACVGVDIGCGMAAVLTDFTAADLPDNLTPLLSKVEQAVPAGVGRGHDKARPLDVEHSIDAWFAANQPQTELDKGKAKKAANQMGSLGAGNHFAEVSLDEDDRVWIVLHSGSRGIGNQLAQGHMATAKKVMARLEVGLEDPDLAYLLEGTPEFDHYIADLMWAQAYARKNRETMLNAMMAAVFAFIGKGRELDRVNCHHNYTAKETHFGREVWVTRKGAISARVGERGIIPGSMGTDTFVVSGLGNPDSYHSSAHGAGRKMSRTRARKELSAESLTNAMAGRTWLADRADRLVDEHPEAYKDINEVMRHQADLVEVQHRLGAVLNYKGT